MNRQRQDDLYSERKSEALSPIRSGSVTEGLRTGIDSAAGDPMAAIDTATMLYGLIGHPVAHSRSPYLQNELIRYRQINARYLAFDIKSGSVEAALKGAFDLGIRGFNVTVPYKQAVMPFLSVIDEKAALIGAVNTLKYEEDGWHGYNTDMPGLMRAFSDDGVLLDGRKVVILGAGGAANAAVCAAAECGALCILIVNRTEEKARELCMRFEKHYPKTHFYYGRIDTDTVPEQMDRIVEKLASRIPVAEGGAEERADIRKDPWIALQTTSVGMHPETDRTVIADPRFYERVGTGYDIIFNPPRTRFMKLTEEAGGRTYNGLKMLLFQGIRSFEIWHDETIGNEIADTILSGMLKTF